MQAVTDPRREILAGCRADKGRFLPRFLAVYALTLLPLALTLALVWHWPGVPMLVLLWLVAGFTQNALGILMHEGSHYFFHAEPRVNDALADLLVCLPIFNTVSGYRAEHMEHHRHSGDPEDPAFGLYGLYRSRGQFLWCCVQDLLGVTSFRAFTTRYQEKKARKKNPWYFLPGLGLIQLGLLGLFTWCTGLWWGYFAFWMWPLLVVPSLVNRLRTFVEHQALDPQTPANRTTRPTLFEYLTIAPYGYAYHFIHHLQLNVPYHQLRHGHELLLEKGHAYSPAELSPHGYLRTFWTLFRTLP